MLDWQRYGLMVAMGPILWLQGKYVRKVTPRLPEPEGVRSGIAGTGPRLRLLITGDSAAAGVGAESQSAALSGQLLEQLAQHFSVEWQLMAVSGLDSIGMMALFENAPATKFDVVIMSMGANDVTSLMSPPEWLSWQDRLAQEIQSRFEPELLVHSAVPPMERFTALPQPLRWFIGQWAAEMNRQLQASLSNSPSRLFHHPFQERVPGGLASDGFHPGPLAYTVWAQGLSREILSRIHRP
jgi:lysophospholipase L1-like esterase